ncbi:hemagglutinin protein [Winogradskyella sp. A3E31]|uniref:hemagglutinin protein n=1 Tax=Winogradskyella sp. A3E31 TaxID=3349637 RepID=UPI00398B2B71
MDKLYSLRNNVNSSVQTFVKNVWMYREGYKRFLPLTLLFAQLSVTAQSIEKFSIDSGGANASQSGIEVNYTIGEVHVSELSTASVNISEGFITKPFNVLISPKVLLQGPLLNPENAGLMNDHLRTNVYIPTTSPYLDNATCDVSVFNTDGNDAIVDWVWVELRSYLDNTILSNGKSALLQRDGDVVTTDGASNLMMSASPKSYYVVINHRNHLGAMSQNTIGLKESTTVVDFSDNDFITSGSNARVQLSSGEMALWSGDITTTNTIKFSGTNNDTNTIKDMVLTDPANVLNFITFSSQGYLIHDIDLNGIARFSGAGSDSNIIKDNVLAFPNNALGFITYTINGTVPETNNN